MKFTDSQKRIIRLLYKEGSLSRKALAESLSLSKAALTFVSKPLLDEFVFVSLGQKEKEGKAGRREEMLQLNPCYGDFLSIAIHKNSIRLTSADFTGGEAETTFFKTEKEATHAFEKRLKTQNALAVSVLMKGQASLERLQKEFPLLSKAVLDSNLPFTIMNNVAALARVYAFLHGEQDNFLLVKYGPGLGSSIYVNGGLLGSYSELGHTYVGEKPLEEQISFHSLLQEEIEEKEAAKRILSDEALLHEAMKKLSFGLFNASELLNLGKIVLSGIVLENEKARDLLIQELSKIEDGKPLPKVVNYPNYCKINELKGCLLAFLSITDCES